ncbi:hypothetical protein AN219_06790, partial [Streptomyces nanshensis]
AEPQPDGTYRLFGTKMWISGGDHELSENIVHLVLARVPGGPAGVKGLSLFVVPKYLVGPDGGPGERNDVVPAGLNHKMGYRGTTNTLLNFGEGARHRPGGAPGAVGHLVGEEHRGLAYMFHMMNGARIGVGAGAMALGYTGYLKSLAYARERPQGRALAERRPHRRRRGRDGAGIHRLSQVPRLRARTAAGARARGGRQGRGGSAGADRAAPGRAADAAGAEVLRGGRA